MKTEQAIAHFKGNVSALARALGLNQSSVYSWGEFPPAKRQVALEWITDGALKAEPGSRERAMGLDSAKAAIRDQAGA